MEPLAHGRPVLVENVEWGGHWRVIIGCRSRNEHQLPDCFTLVHLVAFFVILQAARNLHI